ncbi:hypothetical protein [Rubinisphaera sp.]|uniref:hypothetical protein n=1 Tax=Rubinisphaera sp. TaxID=2024857 RepID=UPI000EDC0168|nr:hypothetical protein [Rubinisphaera sp.]HCS51632.1 hypothetical protein [Planctomycetaceae bacterium]
MSQKRRSATRDDSLELLLDTICNMFGGIVFISLLVVLMLDSSRGLVPTHEEPIDEVEIQKLKEDLTIAKTELERVHQARIQQIEFLAKYVPDDLQDRLLELETLSDQHSGLEKKSLELRENNFETLTALNHTKQSLNSSAEKHDKLNSEVQKLTSEVDAVIDEQSVSFPRAGRKYGVTAIQVSIRFNRLYFRHDLAELHIGNWLPNLEDYVITENDTEFFQVQVRPTGGIDLSDKSHARILIRERLRNYSTSNWSISMTLWPDSFESFRPLREVLSELGYNFTAITPDSAVYDRGGEDRLFQ